MESFIHLVDDYEESHLSYITAVDQKKQKLKIFKIFKSIFIFLQVELLNSISAGEKSTITIEYFVTQILKPFPAAITQSEVQFVVYEGNVHAASAYNVLKETSTVILPQGKLESYTPVSPSRTESGKIIYGPYENVKPMAVKKIKVHAENNSPFVVATNVERLIEVSHWGNIAIEEKIALVHKGAELKGPFSRLDFQIDRRGSKRPVFTHYKTLLPASAKDIYYRDEIGNISTSEVQKLSDALQLTIQPRFPLFGGWKTDYILGYNVPAYQYLYSLGNAFALKMLVIDHIFDNAIVEHFKLKIMLPEGSRNFKLITPYSVKRLPDETFYTYLDTVGRPVIIFEKENLVDAHIQQFTLHYEFDRIQLWREPFIACTAFALLYLVVIIYVRLDFTIVSDPVNESRLQAQGQVEQLTELHADRLKIYDRYIDAANKFRNNKDPAGFAAARRKADIELKSITQSINDLQIELKSNVEIVEKLNDVQKMNKTAVDSITTYLGQVERLVKGQISKTAFAEIERNFNQKMNELKEKMDSLIYAL
ncbi:unnamed protein product [Dracunculus medinensis]|uniref:Dolichyl-diphosphooligosaccharide--protein glycosyltransferase subunit 1 n=1 Tax=Dracunculus medinensis TaxID=318479 RepID=A0A0N4UC62_DRAME|nr:unnamed protein product [Dracunculus medinensis]